TPSKARSREPIWAKDCFDYEGFIEPPPRSRLSPIPSRRPLQTREDPFYLDTRLSPCRPLQTREDPFHVERRSTPERSIAPYHRQFSHSSYNIPTAGSRTSHSPYNSPPRRRNIESQVPSGIRDTSGKYNL